MEHLLRFSFAKTSRPSLPGIYVAALGPVYSIWPMEILNLSSLEEIVLLVWSKTGFV